MFNVLLHIQSPKKQPSVIAAADLSRWSLLTKPTILSDQAFLLAFGTQREPHLKAADITARRLDLGLEWVILCRNGAPKAAQLGLPQSINPTMTGKGIRDLFRQC